MHMSVTSMECIYHSPRYVTLDAVTAPQRLSMEAVIMTTTGLPARSVITPMNAETRNCAMNTILLTCKTDTFSLTITSTRSYIPSSHT